MECPPESVAAHGVAGGCVVEMTVWPLGETSHERLRSGESEVMADFKHTVSKHRRLPAGKGLNFRFLLSSGRAN